MLTFKPVVLILMMLAAAFVGGVIHYAIADAGKPETASSACKSINVLPPGTNKGSGASKGY